MSGEIWKVPYAVTAQLIRDADSPDAQAVFASCTNLPTYDLIAPLEAELGKPVLTANQVTLWAALRQAGSTAVGTGQRLLTQGGPSLNRTQRPPVQSTSLQHSPRLTTTRGGP